ncbi:IclR family transcriptional regulator [Planococcus shenhongbingii]|uniref:IclR family transcriptional regulator n=1 Tax=Planococcus shenhongbingii TaxID=3058398 RepID=UPI0026353722|nr:IclR family transcriptional regulator [Planococcus sp. N016]WKA59324.1 IclR family transcriptional regulator [Planococcus sp. N016]
MSNYEVAALKKGLQILDLLQEEEFLTLTEISTALSFNKTTAFRLLSTLENMNYVIKKDKYFKLNEGKFYQGHSTRPFDWTSLKTPYQLGVEESEGVYIGVLENNDVVMKQMLKPPFKEPFQPEIGDRSPAHISALGKVILANLQPAELEGISSCLSLSQATDQTFIDRELFEQHLDIIQKQGFAIDDEERFVGVRCIAAPVFYKDRVIAAVAIAGPVDKMKKTLLRGLTNKVKAVSKEITKELDLRY